MSGVCYLILCHDNIEQVKVFVDSLSADDAYFVIHIDKKAQIDTSFLSAIPRVHVMQERVSVVWGTTVEAIIKMSEYAYKNIPNVSHYILLSGADFPVKTHKYISDYLASKADTDFITGIALPSENCCWLEGGRRRIEAYAVRLKNHSIATIEPRKVAYQNFRQFAKVLVTNIRMLPTALKIFFSYPKRCFPPELIPYGGELWWMLSRNTLKEVLNWNRSHPDYYNYHKNTQIPDEMYFNSIVYHLSSNVVNDIKRYISWKSITDPSPIWLTYPNDKDIIDDCISNPDIFFVRKTKDNRLIDYIKSTVKF